MKLSDVTEGEDYAYQPSYGPRRRVTVLSFEKVAQTDRWNGKPNGRFVTKALVKFANEEIPQTYVEARYLEHTWAEQEKINEKNEASSRRTARQREALRQLRVWLDSLGVKPRGGNFAHELAIPLWELEKFADAMGVTLTDLPDLGWQPE